MTLTNLEHDYWQSSLTDPFLRKLMFRGSWILIAVGQALMWGALLGWRMSL